MGQLRDPSGDGLINPNRALNDTQDHSNKSQIGMQIPILKSGRVDEAKVQIEQDGLLEDSRKNSYTNSNKIHPHRDDSINNFS